MAEVSDRLKQIAKITSALNAKARKKNPDAEAVAFVAQGNEHLLSLGHLKSGNPVVDRLLDGGFPRGSTSLLVGREGIGKSRLALDTVAYNHQTIPEFVAIWVQLEERAFPRQAALEAGVDEARLIVIPAQNSAEQTFDKLIEFLFDWDTMTPLNLIDMVVVDSIAAAVPEDELKAIREEGFGKVTVGRQGAMMSKVFRAIAGCGCLRRTALLLINQVRVNIGAYGSPETMPGGHSSRHYPKIILKLTKTEDIKKTDKVIGHTIKVKVTKNNTGVGHPQVEGEYKVLYGVGVDRVGPLLDLALAKGAIRTTGGGNFYWDFGTGEQKLKGKENLEALLRNDPDFLQALEQQIAASDKIPALPDPSPEEAVEEEITDAEEPTETEEEEISAD